MPYAPAPVPSPPAGVDLCYVIEYYVIDDMGAIAPDGYHNFVTGGKTPVAEYTPAANLKRAYRRSTDNAAPDYKLQYLAVPEKVLAAPNVSLQIYTFVDGDRRDYVDACGAGYLRGVTGVH